MFTETDIKAIVDKIGYHYTMMIFTSLGDEVLSDADKFLLTSYGVDIEKLREEFPPYMQMFMLGRLTAVLKEHQVRQLTTEDFKKYLDRGQFIPLSSREREEYRISREMTYGHLKGLANKVTGITRDKILEQNKMQLIQETISQGIKDRKSIQSIVSDLGHKTGEWDRDWRRIVVTEMQNIYNQGRASEITRRYGEDQYVWKQVFPFACRHCIRLYTTAGVGSKPRIFKLSMLVANGNNMDKKVDEWEPIVGATHPHCRCDLRQVFPGQEWDEIKGAFGYTGERERKVKRTSKIKITVGDKEFLV